MRWAQCAGIGTIIQTEINRKSTKRARNADRCRRVAHATDAQSPNASVLIGKRLPTMPTSQIFHCSSD